MRVFLEYREKVDEKTSSSLHYSSVVRQLSFPLNRQYWIHTGCCTACKKIKCFKNFFFVLFCFLNKPLPGQFFSSTLRLSNAFLSSCFPSGWPLGFMMRRHKQKELLPSLTPSTGPFLASATGTSNTIIHL